mmetsp:Transcript_26544/g.76705  ORF Transcript_26544/g.76705 Transcript_26544/m.76705 type:complete len:218 (+) Transcript_26544:398-1051(+)
MDLGAGRSHGYDGSLDELVDALRLEALQENHALANLLGGAGELQAVLLAERTQALGVEGRESPGGPPVRDAVRPRGHGATRLRLGRQVGVAAAAVVGRGPLLAELVLILLLHRLHGQHMHLLHDVGHSDGFVGDPELASPQGDGHCHEDIEQIVGDGGQAGVAEDVVEHEPATLGRESTLVLVAEFVDAAEHVMDELPAFPGVRVVPDVDPEAVARP